MYSWMAGLILLLPNLLLVLKPACDEACLPSFLKIDPSFSFLEARGAQGGPGGPQGALSTPSLAFPWVPLALPGLAENMTFKI